MAFLQSDSVKRVTNTATAGCAGTEVAQMFEFTFTGAALAVGDVIELGILPAYNAITGGFLMSSNTTLAGDIGIMSGEVGDVNAARTVNTELFAAKAVASATLAEAVNAVSALTIAKTDKDRSIGFKVTATATPAAGGKLRLLLKYAA